MRIIEGIDIINSVESLCIKANTNLSKDVLKVIGDFRQEEPFTKAKEILEIIEENAQIAKDEAIPMCQDTGFVIVYVEIGQNTKVVGGYIDDLINEGVRRGYKKGYLRKSVVEDPLKRVNTNDNTPAVIYHKIVKNDGLKITVVPKGFGSENMSKIHMLKPTEGIEGVKRVVLETVKEAGPNPCPPIVVGVGIGGTFDYAAYLSKKALSRDLDEENGNDYYQSLEADLLDEINKLGIGPQGFGGMTTALSVNIESFGTHIAGLPVAVNIGCHAYRHKEIYLEGKDYD